MALLFMQWLQEQYVEGLLKQNHPIDILICPAGGTSIEGLAEKYPEKIIKIPVDIFEGITDEQANQMVEGLAVKGDKKAAAEQIKSLYKCFTESDCTMVEVRYLVRNF